jgi:hypothetical protein
LPRTLQVLGIMGRISTYVKYSIFVAQENFMRLFRLSSGLLVFGPNTCNHE